MQHITRLFLGLVAAVLVSSAAAQDIYFAIKPAQGLQSDLQSSLDRTIRGAFARQQFSRDDDFALVQIVPTLTFSEGKYFGTNESARISIVGQMTCTVRMSDGSQPFGTFRVRDTGTAENDSLARVSLLNNLHLEGEQFDSFTVDVKRKIIAYFQGNCPKMMADAQAKSAANDIKGAFKVLYNVPAACTCRPAADSLFWKIYAQESNNICQYYLEKSKKAAELRDYSAALTALKYLDPTSTCIAEGEAKAKVLERHLNEYDRDQIVRIRESWAAAKPSDALKRVIWKTYLLER